MTGLEAHKELYVLCESVLNGKTPMTSGIQTIRSHFLEKDETTASALFDVITALSLTVNAEQKDKALQFFTLISKQLLPEDLLKLELPQLGADSLKSKIIKSKTKIYYKQIKFNLFREENEGYAKLVTELLSVEMKDNVDVLFSRLSQLIGTFNLDPNRTVDVIIDCFSCNSSCHRVYINLLKAMNFEVEVVKKIVLLKFIMFKNCEQTTNSMYRVIAMLCAIGILDIREIFAAIHPPRAKLVEMHRELKKLTTKRVNKAETISTIAAYQLEEQTTNGNAMNMALNDNYSSSSSSNATRSFSSVVYAQEIEDRKICGDFFDERSNLERNQKLGLLLAAVEIGSWSVARQLFPLFPDGFPLALSRRLANGLCELLEYIIYPLYNSVVHVPWPNSVRRPKNWDGVFFEKPDRLHKWADLKPCVLPIVRILGPYIGINNIIRSKFIRLLGKFFDDENAQSEPNRQEIANLILHIVDFSLLPSASFGDSTYSYVDELWKILKHVPYEKRYMMYGRWKGIHSTDCYGLQLHAGKITGQMKYVMKRLSKETVKVCGRQLGKICLTHPTVAFDFLLERLQFFENLIGPVVESMVNLSDLAFDILSYSLIESLASPSKQSLKTSDGTLSKWLQALAAFSGAVYRRYNVEYEGLLQYIANQLKDGKSFDLMVLREVLTATTGFEPLQSLTKDQLDALCSGENIRQEVFGRLGSYQKGRRQAISRLRDALLHTDLCQRMAILLAQQKNCVIYVETKDVPAKLASQILDQCQETFLQYISFVRSNIKDDEYRERVPLIGSLIIDSNVPSEAAFHLARSNYVGRAISSFDLSKKFTKETNGVKKLDVSTKHKLYAEAFDSTLKSLEEELIQTKPSEFWTDLSSKVYGIFWLLTINDIYVCKELYEREFERIRRDLSDLHKSDSKSRRAKEDRLKSLEQKLTSELNRQDDYVKRTQHFITNAKETLFAKTTSYGPQMLRFLHSCILPRCVFSEVDAVYCARFIFLLHSIRTGWFTTLNLIDKIINDITPFLSAFSENEASAFGKFLSLLLETATRWATNEDVFKLECDTFPGFITMATSKNSFDSYRTIYLKWQIRLCRTLGYALSEKGNYILVRNGFLVLNKVLNSFPLITNYTTDMEKAATGVRDREKEKRQDLSVMAQSYLVLLKKRNVKLYELSDFPSSTTTTPKSQNYTSQTNGTPKSNGVSRQQSTRESSNGAEPNTQVTPTSSSRKRPNDSSSQSSTEAKHSRRDRERIRP
ncbi:THO complex subunit 2 [Aphelenchoides besseyi]|nr:THO complex subunit 2 [Aphelenchoides besseyi]